MPSYEIEIIHEPTGTHMNFEYESDEDKDNVWNEILADLSVVAYKVD